MSMDLALGELVENFHKDKDQMHGMAQLDRLRFRTKQLCQKIGMNPKNINYALYFYDLTIKQKDELENFFVSYGFSRDKARYLRQLSTYIDRSSHPGTDEEKLIHDVHMLEGGPYFGIIKSLITGSLNYQTLQSSLDYFEQEILPQSKCYFPQTKQLLDEQLKISKDMLKSLRFHLPIE